MWNSLREEGEGIEGGRCAGGGKKRGAGDLRNR